MLARGADELEDTAGRLRALGVRASAPVVDLADVEGVERAVDRVRSELGGVDVLVNAAGTDVPGPVADLDVADWDRVLDVNLRASFLLARAIWPDMVGRGGAAPTVPADALAPDQVARLIAWIAAAPPDVVLNEVTVTPLLEQGWP